MDVAGQWREGVIYPRWAEWSNWGFGEPRFVFYPPASWLIGAALGSVLPWRAVPGAYIWLALILAGMSMWKLSREWLPGPQAAAAAVLFAVNPYNLAIVYYRSDFAELLAASLLPLLLWAALGVIGRKSRPVPVAGDRFSPQSGCGNAPEGVIAAYSLALLLVVAAIRRRSMRPLSPGAWRWPLVSASRRFIYFPPSGSSPGCKFRKRSLRISVPSGILFSRAPTSPNFCSSTGKFRAWRWE